MIAPQAFFDTLIDRQINFFSGVPDSLLKDFCAYVTDHTEPGQHIIAANEGGAVALAAGHYLATRQAGLVYMQNSGQGNAINPLLSLADPDVFGIPMLLMIGWRGEPGHPDEPQHVKQGRVTLALLDSMSIPWAVLPESIDRAKASLDVAVPLMVERQTPYALVVRNGTFAKYRLQSGVETHYELGRESALALVLEAILPDDIVVATTGMLSRELFELRQSGRQHQGDLRVVGSMGHASQLALAIALARPDRQVFCLDGDGAVIMHAGGLAIVGTERPTNLKHIVFNNGAHDSVGGQPTAGFAVDLAAVARALGYRGAASVESGPEVRRAMSSIRGQEGPLLVEIRINKGARANLGRPTSGPAANKAEFMTFLGI